MTSSDSRMRADERGGHIEDPRGCSNTRVSGRRAPPYGSSLQILVIVAI